MRIVDKKKTGTLLTLLFFVTFIAYLDRVSIAYAIIPIGVEYSLSPLEKGYILGAFSFGYVGFMIPFGVMVDRYGPRVAAACSVSAWSILMLWTALVSTRSELFFARFALGAAEAPIFPANAKLVSQHIPESGRAWATGVFDSGSYIGMAAAGPIVVLIAESLGWRWAFVFLAVLGVVWLFFWKMSVHLFSLSPQAVPAGERTRISLPVMGALLRNRKILAASMGFFCYNYVKAFFLTWLPSFLVAEKGMTAIATGWLAITPPLVAVIVELAVARWSDGLYRRTGSKQLARKLPICLGLLAATVLGFAPQVNDIVWLTVLLCIAFSGVIAASPAIWSIPADLAPTSDYVATIGGIQNAFSNIAGIVAPIVTGWIWQQSGSFEPALLLTVVIALFGVLMYSLMIGRIEPIVLKLR